MKAKKSQASRWSGAAREAQRQRQLQRDKEGSTVSVAETARLLGFSEDRVRRLIKAGVLRAFPPNARVKRVLRVDIEHVGEGGGSGSGESAIPIDVTNAVLARLKVRSRGGRT
jgi:hypothetical protein